MARHLESSPGETGPDSGRSGKYALVATHSRTTDRQMFPSIQRRCGAKLELQEGGIDDKRYPHVPLKLYHR
jgi:hypothetical protein